MRSLVVAIVVVAAPSYAKPAAQDTTDWVVQHLDRGAFGDSVVLGAMWFADPACRDRFAKSTTVSGDDLVQLAACLWTTAGFLSVYHLGDRTIGVLRGEEPVAIELGFRRGRIVKLGPAAATKTDGSITLDRGPDASFVPSAGVRAAIDRGTAAEAEAIFKLCHDAAGKLTSRRVLARSGNDAFDRNANLYARKREAQPFAPGGSPVTACELVTLRYPLIELDSGHDANPEAIPHDKITASALLANHIAGDRHIEPDDVTKVEIMRSGKDRVIASFHLCVDARGEVDSTETTQASGFAAFDVKLQHGMREWRFKPFASGVCAPITFVYMQI